MSRIDQTDKCNQVRAKTEMQNTKLITRKHAAKRLSVSESTIKRMEKGGQLTRITINCRNVRYREDQVEKLMQADR